MNDSHKLRQHTARHGVAAVLTAAAVVCALALLFLSRPTPDSPIQFPVVPRSTCSSPEINNRLIFPLLPPSPSSGKMQLLLDYRQAHDQVYAPNKYSACASSAPLCWLMLSTPVDCEALFTAYVEILQNHVPVFPPPRQLDPAHKDEFLLNGFSQLSDLYFGQADYAPGAVVPVWNESMISPMVQRAKARRPVGQYHAESLAVYQALDCHPVTDKTGAVFGTAIPWAESILFAFGAKHVTTIEFRSTVSHISRHTVIKPLEWAQKWKSGGLQPVDFAFSFSSWEHDGLGRYGDPLDPWGDIKAMQRASCYVKPGGLLFFGAPVSTTDQLQYNAHRIYGFVRLPLLTANWEVLGVYESDYRVGVCGVSTCAGLYSHWDQKKLWAGQPVVVLRNLRITPCERSNEGQ